MTQITNNLRVTFQTLKITIAQMVNQQSTMKQRSRAKKLKGHLLLVETKQVSAKLTEAQQKEAKKKTFRKLHIVEMKDLTGPLYMHENSKKASSRNQAQSLEQIDLLTITE